ncbi:PepSY-associated TM helix domain-containing protein [Pseudemcibacter aquimaris]|uniref:PepSY-associated TM helix domain-containing protein n=1 Tax=Pseudemcibacter aquimaris TaxID=2857064 RepID=UPI002012C0DB|nr:PepSY-associated TM helix domain-containing protein [Pseudemcibacter aquimaris]MCC3861578.1 PepSY domain-containing protein [Pseudemcibacter aquimaris]WDU58347.1 PepSY domain-containing protein [Pseudemcibacter aquimaris]
MEFRKLIYWPHLICGVIAGVLIFIMSVTGVILTYERQMISWAEGSYDREVPMGEAPLSIDEILSKNNAAFGEKPLRSVKLENNPEAPVVVRGGDYYYINRYNGEILGNGPKGVKGFFSDMRSLHRWLLMTGENRSTARMFTGAANLMFLFIVISGMYLWLPRVFTKENFKKILFFRKTNSSRARDFNWHNVMGIWSAIPLIVIVATATVFYYSWANNLVYQMAGEEPPVRNRGAQNAGAPTFDQNVPFESMFDKAVTMRENWTTITMTYPKATDENVRFSVDTGNGGEPQKKADLYLSRADGGTAKWEPYQDYSTGKQARYFIRFLHTGEALGIIGQTVAGIVSLFAAILVWTGLALAYRKYIKPLTGRKAKKARA